METSKRKIDISADDVAIDEQNVKRVHVDNGAQPDKCCCNLILQQQQEIERLKTLLQIQEGTDRTENKTWPDSSLIEEKLNRLVDLIEKKPETKPSTAPNFSLDSLHTKVDKLVRLMGTTFEAQAKMAKTMESLMKSNKVKPPPDSIGATLKNLQKKEEKEKKKEEEEPPVEDVQDILERQKMDNGLNEFRWGQNLMLLGDNLWRSFNAVDDVNVMIKKMEKFLNFKISCRTNEVISRLYDEKRDKLLFALPPKVYRVAISVGTYDLMTDDQLLTLREASLEEVKVKNRAPLQEKARQLKGMIQKLLSLQKHVILVIPPAGTQKVEVFRHWEEVVLDVMQDLDSPSFRILNLPDLVRSTLPDFKSQEDHLTTWFSNLLNATLSPYGTRRLFDSLKRTVWARTKKTLESRTFLNDSQMTGAPEATVCPRCTRTHPGGPNTCKSIDKMCRQCGVVGHYVEVHAVTDYKLRKQIVETLGFDIYTNVAGCEPEPVFIPSVIVPVLPQPSPIEWPAPGMDDWKFHHF